MIRALLHMTAGWLAVMLPVAMAISIACGAAVLTFRWLTGVCA